MTISVEDNVLRCIRKFGAKVASTDLQKRGKWQARPHRELIAPSPAEKKVDGKPD